nr:polymorphic toxin-type HINT domain-containing protein [Clostridium septicum]
MQDGELVLSKDTKTGQVDYKSVIYVYRKSTTNFINLTVAGKRIETTPTHLFMLEDGNWRSAENLKAGDRIVTANGEIKTVDSVEEKHYNEARRIYNLNVDEFHTYFVGSDELLVHNNCSEEATKDIVESIKKGKTPT